jgi:hypothetical protein
MTIQIARIEKILFYLYQPVGPTGTVVLLEGMTASERAENTTYVIDNLDVSPVSHRTGPLSSSQQSANHKNNIFVDVALREVGCRLSVPVQYPMR